MWHFGLLCNLLLKSLVEEAEGEIWSYPICARDRLSQERGLLPVKNVTGDERAHAQNKSFILDALNNEFDRAVKFSLTKRGYTHILRMNQLIVVAFLCNIKLKATC